MNTPEQPPQPPSNEDEFSPSLENPTFEEMKKFSRQCIEKVFQKPGASKWDKEAFEQARSKFLWILYNLNEKGVFDQEYQSSADFDGAQDSVDLTFQFDKIEFEVSFVHKYDEEPETNVDVICLFRFLEGEGDFPVAMLVDSGEEKEFHIEDSGHNPQLDAIKSMEPELGEQLANIFGGNTPIRPEILQDLQPMLDEANPTEEDMVELWVKHAEKWNEILNDDKA